MMKSKTGRVLLSKRNNQYAMTIYRTFLIVAFMYCTILSFIFVQDIDQAMGDEGTYIELAKQFLGTSEKSADLSHRQPLYSFVLAGFIHVFDIDGFVRPVTIFQFILVFISSLLVYAIFKKLSSWKFLPLIAAVAYLLNLSTIVFAYSMLTETISLFIFLLIVYLLLRTPYKNDLVTIVFIGILSGMMVLARFNAMGLPVVVLIILLFIHLWKFRFNKIPFLITTVSIFILATSVPLLGWAYYNHVNRGFFGIIPSHHVGQRWAIPAVISESNIVSPAHEEVLNIFLRARANVVAADTVYIRKKGSLLNNEFLKKIYFGFKPEVNGFYVFSKAKTDLLMHFELDANASNSDAKLGNQLKPFYNEIAMQSKKELFRLRLFSLLETFRVSASSFPQSKTNDFNVFPSLLLTSYRIVGILIFGFVYLISCILGIKLLISLVKGKLLNVNLLILILIIAYFPMVHFYANVLGDANRFKFPSEPILIGLFLYYIYLGMKRLKKANY